MSYGTKIGDLGAKRLFGVDSYFEYPTLSEINILTGLSPRNFVGAHKKARINTGTIKNKKYRISLFKHMF